MSLKHNKKRSTGIVYELLVRKITESLIKNDKKSANAALKIVKKYFSPGTPIGRELEAIDVMRKTRGIDRSLASRVLQEVAKTAAGFDRRVIDIKKSNLIKEINYTFGQEFFSSFKLQEYRALASMQVFVESCSNARQTLSEGVERAKIEEAIVEYMRSTATDKVDQIDPNRNHLSYGIALKKFQEKYGNVISGKKKELLESYVYGLFSGDFRKFKSQASSDKEKIYRKIVGSFSLNECRSDKVLLERLNESAVKLKQLSVSTNESFVAEMMLYYDLYKEIDSNE